MSTKQYKHWTSKISSDGIAWLHLDVAEEKVNVLSTTVFEELEDILTRLESSPPKGVAVISDKESGFIAGADVKEFTQLLDRETALAFIKRGQRIMDRLAALTSPTVAIINGYCVGGGLELSLACDYRIGKDDPKTRLSFPEVKLGIHPGYGGTARSLHLLGPIAAMDLMLTGRSIDVRRARKIGLVDYVVPQRHLQTAACSLIETKPPKRRMSRLSKLLNLRIVRPLLARNMRHRVAAKAKKEHYPAPYALIRLWERYADNARIMLDKEAQSVADLSTTETARNLIRVFALQNRLKAQGNKLVFRPQHVHVIGGGLMGGDIAAWCALQGFSVTVQDPDNRSLAETLKRAAALYRKRFKVEHLVKRRLDRLIPDNKGFGLKRADVVIEAIIENVEVKQTLFRQIEPQLKPDTLIVTNTSSIPIERLAEGLNDSERFVGLHFFNPVAQLPLVEVVCGVNTREEVIRKALAFARQIDKLALKVKSTPGFLVNRILMPYLLEAIIMESEGVPKSVIDSTATDFGMPMGPLELADSVGLDIGLHVGEIVGKAYGFDIPERLRTMVRKGQLGRKSGMGFYTYKKGKPLKDGQGSYSGDTKELQNRLILRLVNEAIACLREGIVEDADLIDAGVIFGTGFAPFRGGPLNYIENEGRKTMQQSLKQLQDRFGDRFAADAGW